MVPEDSFEISNCDCLDLVKQAQSKLFAGDMRGCVAVLQMALSCGTEDTKILTTIYNMMANAYYFSRNFIKALEYGRYYFLLAKALSDLKLEANASSNLGNTLKALGRYDEALRCCQRHLELSQALGDKPDIAVAHYHFANVFYAKGNHVQRERGVSVEFCQQVRDLLGKAVEHYEMNLKLVRELGDRRLEGGACGNLGNTHYLLGHFQQAVDLHSERLKIAEEFGDRAAMRRAYTNLGNACVFLGELEAAVKHYRKSIRLAKELRDIASEAQSYYSLGNCFALLGDFKAAAQHHLYHLSIARVLNDKIGQARAAWSLSNVCLHMAEPAKAFYFALLQHMLCKELRDKNGEMMADLNIVDLLPNLSSNLTPDSSMDPNAHSFKRDFIDNFVQRLKSSTTSRRFSDSAAMASGAIESSPEKSGLKRARSPSTNVTEEALSRAPSEDSREDDNFFDYICRAQSKRMDEQRFDPKKMSTVMDKEVDGGTLAFLETMGVDQPDSDDMLTMIIGMQSRRMDDQRATLPFLPGLQQADMGRADSSPAICLSSRSTTAGVGDQQPKDDVHDDDEAPKGDGQTGQLDDSFFDMVIRCQDNRIEDQRSSFPTTEGITVPDEAFFQFLLKHQARRIEEQRAHFNAIDKVEKASDLRTQ